MTTQDVRFGVQGGLTAGTGKQEKPALFPNLVAITLSPNTMEQPIYADNRVIYTAQGTSSVALEITAVSTPDEFKIRHAGEVKTVKGGIAGVLGTTNNEPFDLIFDSTGTRPRRVLIRNCTVVGSIKHDYTTNTEGIEQQNDIISAVSKGTLTADGKHLVWQEVYDINSEAAKALETAVPEVPEIKEATTV